MDVLTVLPDYSTVRHLACILISSRAALAAELCQCQCKHEPTKLPSSQLFYYNLYLRSHLGHRFTPFQTESVRQCLSNARLHQTSAASLSVATCRVSVEYLHSVLLETRGARLRPDEKLSTPAAWRSDSLLATPDAPLCVSNPERRRP